ncbi:zf-CCCH domain-containing protein [Cephalotus follicularis]|uniref:Zf-CCCH domain-containing protein n=1 Tax=Cephalotus follicularis TaxID=3775 RepID=A0A1Q3BW17_CEPFO|nr:zf-CCCH domain-containing protein [Cephalotus follicularis]
MPENRQVQSNAVSIQSTDNIEEAIRRLKINDNYEGGGVSQPIAYPDRPGEPDCLFYLRTGLCGYGSSCRFNHPAYVSEGTRYREELPERVGQPDCGYFLKTGTCKYGSTCKYHHPKDRNGAGPVSFNILGLPMRQDEKPCPFYMRNGSCKFGVACKFNHPQPASPGTGLSITGPAFGSTGSSNLPSSGMPYVGGISSWSFPRSTYISSPHLQGPQAYMPVVLSPSQGILPAQGWNTYMGNTGSSTGILGSNVVYNSRNPGESGTSGQGHLLSSSFPDRPDQPECRYFMNTGTCKYGPDCKYHHPKERIAQETTSTVSLLVLPSRPGQPVCVNYSMYGICKYGPTCRYDHPFSGYMYNYGLSVPPLSVLDSPLMNYPRLLPNGHPSEMSPSISLKFPGRIRNSDAASNKYRISNTKNTDDLPEQAGSPPHSAETSSPPHDQSD